MIYAGCMGRGKNCSFDLNSPCNEEDPKSCIDVCKKSGAGGFHLVAAFCGTDFFKKSTFCTCTYIC